MRTFHIGEVACFPSGKEVLTRFVIEIESAMIDLIVEVVSLGLVSCLISTGKFLIRAWL